jgi:predicted SAM-dependent methyltransferase
LKALQRTGWQVSRLDDGTADIGVYKRAYAPESLRRRAFYNIGSGDFFHPYWTNVDHPSAWYTDEQSAGIDIAWDAETLDRLPPGDGTAEALYTSHTIEHLSDAAAGSLFREAYRILKPGGILRVTTPDIALDFRAWRDRDPDYWYWAQWYSTPESARAVGALEPLATASVQQLFVWQFASALSMLHVDGADERLSDDEVDRLFTDLPMEDALNDCTARVPEAVHRRFPGNHRNWWTRGKAERLLREAGFNDPRLSGYGQSYSPAMRNTSLFDSTHPRISLYVEAAR